MSREQKQTMLTELMERKKQKDSYYPLSSGQKGLWFLQRMKPKSHVYNVPCAFKVYGTVDIGALKRAFTSLMDRRPILRTVLKTNAGEPLQSVAYKKQLFFKAESITEMAESEIESFLRAVAHEPFDLEKGPLFRVYLFSRSDSEAILLVNLHHIIFDGSSFAVFVDELIKMYRAELTGEKAALPEPGSSFSGYVKWQQKMLAGEEGKAHKAYWLEKLAGDLPVLSLPTDIRPGGSSSSGGSSSGGSSSSGSSSGGCETYRTEITSDLSKNLRKVAADNRVYLFTVLLCSFKVLLHRYTKQDDIITGIPMAGRTRTEFEDLIGYFINMLPVRARLSADISFAELLQQVHEASMGALEHQDYPFPEIVKALRGRGWGDHSENPLFQTSFVLQNWAKEFEKNFVDAWGDDTGFKLEPMLNIQQEEDFNLALEVLDFERFQFFFKYDSSLYRRDTIVGMADHFKRLLEGIADNPAQKISRLPLLTESDHQKILVEWNDTKADFEDEICLHQLIEAQVDKTPDVPALIFGAEQLSYKDLNGRANQAGRYLQKLGVGPGTRVVICMERSVSMIVGLLGILKAGGAYVPIDPEYPEERIRYMLEDTSAPVLLTQDKLSGSLPEHAAKVVCLDVEWPAISQEDESNIPCAVTPEDLAYIIYTSGSTGRPKGVMVRHRGLPNLAQAQIRLFGVEPISRVLQFASMSFDASISEIAMALCSGAVLYLAPKEDLLPGERLEVTLIRHAITHVTLPPTALTVMAPGKLKTLSTIVVAGEACPPELAVLWSKDRIFINAYGPSESTVCASGMRYDGREGNLPIGRPIDNMQLFILDTHLQPVPIGVPGELHIGGVGLALGYLNRPDLTNEKFILNPLDQEKGSRLYKTGDLCRFLPDGNIEFLGRMDHQVKIRGFRIELGEIEAVLRKHERVKEAVVVVREDRSFDKQLIAYFASEKPEESPTQGELHAHLKAKLPDFMIPAPFVSLETMPLTPSGKIDRKALPAPDPKFIREQAFAAPETKTQEMLVSIWKQVLKTENVSIHDDFFMMGGHSLLATVVISRIQNVFKVNIPIASMFDFPTISEFGGHLEHLLNTEPASYNAIRPVDRSGPLELSFGQQRLWFLDKFEGGNFASYNAPIAFRVAGCIDISAFNSAINEIIRRHEVLRTVFQDPLENQNWENQNRATGEKKPLQEPSPLQVILPELKVNLTLMDIGELPKKEREAKAGRIISDDCLKPFDLSQGPLIRALLVRMTAEEQLLLITLHHIVFDGWSVGVFLTEFEHLYEAHTQAKPSFLPVFDIQYADFAHWQRETLTGETLENQLAYWEKQLAGIPLSTELPTDRPRPPIQTFNGDFIPFQLGPELTGLLNTLGRTSGVTLFMTLYAAFAVLLARYGAKEDIVIGSPVANRNHVQTDHLIGFFVNTLALRADLSCDPAFSELLKRVKKCTLDAYEHQDLPFERLIMSDELNIERSMSQSPLFQVMFDLYNVSDEFGGRFETGGLTFSPYEIDYDVAKFDLTLSMIAGDDTIKGRFQYNTDLFDRATIERTVGHFKELLADIVANPDKNLSELRILPQWEKHRLMKEFNDTKADFPDDTTIHRLIEAQANETPEATAVVFQDEPLSYKTLNERANRTGHYLQKLGVGPDVMVGLYMERSFEMIVGLLGILKAGGAYVPIDPSYPEDRIAYILEDTKAPIILTQARLLDSLPETQARPVCMDNDWETIAGEDPGNVASSAKPDHMIYVIYTSGTTGRPKGVMIEHRSVSARLSFWKDVYQLSEKDVAVHYRPYSFDGSVEEYLLPLSVGAKFIMAPSNIAVTDNIADYLINTIEKYRITKINMPPVLLDVFLTELKRIGPEKVKSLHTVVSGGDKLTRDIVRKFDALFDAAYLYNTYGPTENAIDSLNWRCDLAQGKGRVLLGKSIANTQSYILDRNAELVPLGVPGQLYVSGVGLARGYLNRPDLTKEMFIPNHLSNAPGSRLYKTGDLCRCLADGNFEFLGRIDHQVKIRGFRIELGEIESVLSRHEQVNEAVVIAREDRPGNKQLVAYVIPNDAGQRPEEASVRAFLRTILPDYMMPAFIVFMDELPLTSNGKIDRKALPAPALSAVEKEYTAPRTQTEKILVQIWAETLGLPRVGINDNFFSIGGDSIISIRIISKAAEKGLFLAVKQMFEHPTIAEIAMTAGTRKKISAEQGIVTGALPLTPIMESFFKAPCIDPHHFNQYILVRISDKWDIRVLRKALAVMLSQHDALRLNFTKSDSAWKAACADVAWDTADSFLEVEDLSCVAQNDRLSAMDNLIKKYQEGVDLAAGLLLKAVLCLTGEKENYLWVIIHHLAVDGVSWRIFMENFEQLCTMATNGETMALPAKTTSFKEWAYRLKEYAGSNEVISEKEYWLGQTESLPLPADHPFDPSENTLEAAKTLTVTLSSKKTHTLLHKAPDVYGARINDLLLTVLSMALCRWTGQTKALIGFEGHGREELFEDVDLSRTIGWFTSLFPVVLSVGDRKGLLETVASVKDQLNAIPNRGIGYGVLRYMTPDSATREAFKSLPFPQVIFNYFGQLDESFSGGHFAFDRLGFSQSPGRARKSLIDIGGGIINGTLQIAFSYCRKIHDAPTIQRLADDFDANLGNLIEGCASFGRKRAFVHKDFPQFPELVYLNKGKKGMPVFWIHGGLGGVGAYVKLAQRVQRPFYGIQARGWMTDRTPLSGAREKASYYLRVIRAVQPEGPYHLGGYSYGGTVAYEVTRQLQELGESVASIVMLDSRADSESESEVETFAFNGKQAMLQAVNVALFESTFSRPEKMAQVLIHRNELDLNTDEDLFLNSLIENPKTLRLFKTKQKAAAQVRAIVETIKKADTEKYRVHPLAEPDSVTCHYFRDKSGRLFGDLEPYFYIENETVKERVSYWEVWGKHISDFRLIDVNSPNHMAMLTDSHSFEKIARVCEMLYSDNGITK